MNIIKRILQDKISERIEPNKAVLLFGARRVGKTVLIRELIKEFKGQSMLLNGEDYDTIALLNERSISNYIKEVPSIELVDERLTTVTAHHQLFDAQVGGRKHRPMVDQQSAVVILQTAIDRRERPEERGL